MYHIGEFDGIADEEDGEVIAYDVIIAFFGVEFGGKASWVAEGFGRAGTVDNGRKADEYGGFLAFLVEEFGFGEVGKIVCGDKFAIGASAAGVYDAFGDAFAVEGGEFFEEVDVLEENGAFVADGLGVLIIANRRTGIGREGRLGAEGLSEKASEAEDCVLFHVFLRF